MVNFTIRLLQTSRQYSANFIDSLRIHVKGGTGGSGLLQLGGIGGRGGDVFLVGSKDPELSLKTLKQKFPKKRFTAQAGESSSRRAISGIKGKSIFVQVPHGVSVIDAKNKKRLGNINKPGDRVLVARGGKGGDRYTQFLPRKGEAKSVMLDLRLIADVGFVGFPNAGKSTLLNAISNATPEVADYPFTTLRPHIGVVNFADFRKISCADLPGLIEGAHMNIGMGHKFLKHVERTKLLLFVVDLFGFSLYTNRNLRDAFENVQLLTKELELYNKDLLDFPAMLVFNKMDKEGAQEKFDIVMDKLNSWEEHVHSIPEEMIPERQMNFSTIMSISAKQGTSLLEFKDSLRHALDRNVGSSEFLRLTDQTNELSEINAELDFPNSKPTEDDFLINV